MTKLRAVLIRRWPILVAAIVLGILAGYLSAFRSQPGNRPVQYRAEQVIISNRSASGISGLVEQDTLRLTRGEVLKQAADSLNESDTAKLAKQIAVDTNSAKSSITVYTFDPTAEGSAKRVDAFVKAFLNVVNAELRVEEEGKLATLKARVTEAISALEEFDTANPLAATPALLPSTDPGTQVLIQKRSKLEGDVDKAKSNYDDAVVAFQSKPPYSTLGAENPKVDEPQLLSVPQSPLFRAGLLGGLALALAALLIMLLERINQRIDTREELAEIVNIPIIAEIGHLGPKRQTFHADGRIRLDGIWAEHYRRIRSAVQFVQVQNRRNTGPGLDPAVGRGSGPNGHVPSPGTELPAVHGSLLNPDAPERVFLITSTLPGEGKSTSTALTALALAEVGVETLVINADFRKPRVDGLLGSDKTVTLEDRARFDIDRPSIDQVVRPNEVPHLWTAASGAPTYDVGLRIEAAREVAQEAARRGATVLIDSTPIRVANDTIDLLPAADEVLLVVRTGRSTVESLQDTIELLELHNAPLLGIILIGTRGSRELYAYYDSYYTEVEGSKKRSGRKSKNRYGPDIVAAGNEPQRMKKSGRKAGKGNVVPEPVPAHADASLMPPVAPLEQPAPVVTPAEVPATTPPPLPAFVPSPVNGNGSSNGAPATPPPLPSSMPVPPPLPPVLANGVMVSSPATTFPVPTPPPADAAPTAPTLPPPYQPPSAN